MNELTPEKLRGLLPPHESKGLYVRPSHILIGYDDLLAFAAAWEEDVSDVCTINAELNTTIIRQQKRIEALEADRGHLMILKSVTQAQAMDEAIWGVAVTAMEVYLQRSLRYLHALIEGRPYDGPR